MTDEVFLYRDFIISINANCIKIDKTNQTGRLCATIMYDRKSRRSSFSGQFPWVLRGGDIHQVFDKVIELIGTSTKVTIVKEPEVKALLDHIKR